MKNKRERFMQKMLAGGFCERTDIGGLNADGPEAFYVIEMTGYESDVKDVEREIREIGTDVAIISLPQPFFSRKTSKTVFYYGKQLLSRFLREHKAIKKFLCVTKIWFNSWDEYPTDVETAIVKFDKMLRIFDVDFAGSGTLYSGWRRSFLGCKIEMAISTTTKFREIIEFQKITELPHKGNICYEGGELII